MPLTPRSPEPGYEKELRHDQCPIRDPLADHFLTPQNSAFLFIDYQPSQLATIRSMDPALLTKNTVSTIRAVKAFGVPVVHSTVNVANGQGPTLPELAELLADDKPLDRTTVNSWEDIEFVQAVHATGRRELVICALWTEVCMAFTPSTRCGTDTTFTPWLMRLPAPHQRPTAPGSTAWSKPAGSRSAGFRSPVNCSGTGPVRDGPGDRRDRPHRPPAQGVAVARGKHAFCSDRG
jgi:Isochorismatase family